MSSYGSVIVMESRPGALRGLAVRMARNADGTMLNSVGGVNSLLLKRCKISTSSTS